MTEGEVIAAIPFTAWEQSVFVVLLIVLVIVLLGWVSRENKTSREFQKTESAAREKAQAERDTEWRLFLSQQRANDEQKSEAMTESLNALTAATQALVAEVQGQRADFNAHDQKEWAKLDEMSASIHAKKTQPRKQS